MIEISEEKDKTYRFTLKGENGINLLGSIPFKSKRQIEKIIHQLKPGATSALRFERKTNYNGKFLFNLKNTSGQLIGNSGVFESEAGMENGIIHIKKRLANF